VKTATKIGIVFLVIGFLLLVGFVFLLVMFAVGGSANPPPSSPFREFLSFAFALGRFWLIFVIVGAILIAVGALQRDSHDQRF